VPNLTTSSGNGIDVIKKSFVDLQLKIIFTHIASNKSVEFMGILTNWQDNYESSWNEEDVYGRMDPIATYQGTKRQITIAWTVLSEDDKVGRANLRDISKFINFLYPQYSTTAGKKSGLTASSISNAPLLRLKFMNLAMNSETGEGLVGYINGGVAIVPNMDSGFLIPDSGEMIPKTIDMEVNFSVLHSHDLGFDESGNSLTDGSFPYGATAFGSSEVSAGRGAKTAIKKVKGIGTSGVPEDPGTGPVRGAIQGETNDLAQQTVASVPGGDKVPPGIIQGRTNKMLDSASGGSTW
jgi:hypothetical protein